MTQDYQSLGGVSPELEAAIAEKSGWQGAAPEPDVEEMTDGSDFSIWDRHTNRQTLGRSIPNMAGHVETPTAAQPVTPFDPFRAGGQR